MSTVLCQTAFVLLDHPVLCHGVTWKLNRGIPPSVLQQEEKNRTKRIGVRGTVKAAVIGGDPQRTNLVASSIYNTKSVHYLSMASERVEWIVKEKDVYNVETGMKEPFKFLRLNQIN